MYNKVKNDLTESRVGFSNQTSVGAYFKKIILLNFKKGLDLVNQKNFNKKLMFLGLARKEKT